MAFPIKKFLHGLRFHKSANIGKPMVLEAELAIEDSSTKSWAAYSRLFWTWRPKKFGLSCDFTKTASGSQHLHRRLYVVVALLWRARALLLLPQQQQAKPQNNKRKFETWQKCRKIFGKIYFCLLVFSLYGMDQGLNLWLSLQISDT